MVTSQLRHFAMSISPVHGDSSEAPKRHKFPEESAANQGTSITEPEAHRTTAVVEFQRRTDRWNNMDTDGGGLTARFFSPGTSDRCLRRRTPMGERNDRSNFGTLHRRHGLVYTEITSAGSICISIDRPIISSPLPFRKKCGPILRRPCRNYYFPDSSIFAAFLLILWL